MEEERQKPKTHDESSYMLVNSSNPHPTIRVTGFFDYSSPEKPLAKKSFVEQKFNMMDSYENEMEQ